ncbi:MAG: FAD-dependent oxidoreductase [Opitutales bacterium]|nr:FAD-dependent oxidoreductase [Opitutales bacterium]
MPSIQKVPPEAHAKPIFPEPVDTIINGATWAGVAAAIEMAQAGKKVLLIDEHTFPAADSFACLTFSQPADLRQELAGALIIDPSCLAHDNGLGFHPCRTKCALEDRLLEAGVSIVYLVRPLAWEITEEGLLEVRGTGKSGPWRQRCRTFLEATWEGHFGTTLTPWEKNPVQGASYRRLEYARVDTPLLPPAEEEFTGPQNLSLRWEPGPYDESHCFVEIPLLEAWCGDPLEFASAENKQRKIMEEVHTYLKKTHPAFAKARLANHASLTTGAAQRYFPAFAGGDLPVEGRFWLTGPAALADPEDYESKMATPLARVREGQRVANRMLANTESAPPKRASGELPRRIHRTYLLVVGGGTTGANVAIGAAENDLPVIIAEQNPALGGVGTQGGINSYWFGRRGGHNLRLSETLSQHGAYDSRPPKIPTDIRNWNAPAKSFLLSSLASSSGQVDQLLRCWFVSPKKAGKNKVKGAFCADPAIIHEIEAEVTVDATGDGDVAAASGVPYTYGAKDTGATMWYALVPIKRPAVSSSQFTSWVDIRCPHDLTRAILAGHRREFRPDHHDPWDHAPSLSTRESRHIHGEVTLTLTDQLRQRSWPDAIGLAFSNHDVKGYTESDWIRFGLIPPNLEVEIPWRAQLPVRTEGLLVTGKALSATAEALPAIRMQADLENIGYATGLVIAWCQKEGKSLREVDFKEIRPFLEEKGLLHPNSPTPSTNEPAPASRWPSLIAALDDQTSLDAYQEMPMTETFRGEIPFVELCCADAAILPLLRDEASRRDSPRPLTVALILAWHRQADAAPVLVEFLTQALSRNSGLPPREKPVRYTQPPPDQGNFPECVSLLYALARCGAKPEGLAMLKAFAERIEATEEDLRSLTSGLFDYIDALSHLAEALNTPEAREPLQRLLQQPLWANSLFTGHYQVDWFKERKAFLELRIARALHRLGDPRGTNVLKAYLADRRKPLVNFAQAALS